MRRKLVKLDPNNGGRFSKVDPIALERYALALKQYVETQIAPDNDEYDIRDQVLPLCNGALDDTLKLPLRFADLPLKYPDREGLLPSKFSHLWSNFVVTATGSMLEPPQITIIDGDKYAYMDFEDSGDWPNVVAQRKREYAENLRKSVEADEAGIVAEVSHSVPAGELCPRAGLWFTPASNWPPRHFDVGEIFPMIGDASGDTSWHWSPNQKD